MVISSKDTKRDACKIVQDIKENIQIANYDPKSGPTETATVVLLR